jgi:hypothetical protein
VAIETLADLAQAFADGTLAIVDRPDFLPAAQTAAMHLANAGCMNNAIGLFDLMLGVEGGWSWQVGYDNLAVVMHSERADPIRCISLSPAHALAMAVLSAAAQASVQA